MLWINGRTGSEASLVIDDGFFYGRGVFETLRVGTQPCFWQEHLVRLNQSLVALKIRPPLDEQELLALVKSLPIRDCVLKIAVSSENLVLQTRPLPAETLPAWKLTLAAGHRTASRLLLSSKNLNYLDDLLAWENARTAGYDDAIWLDAAGRIAETSRANLFFLRGGCLMTPDQECGLLPGIARQWVMDHYPVQAGFYTLNDLLAAEAVFVTNSVIGIQPVAVVCEYAFADSLAVRRIRQEYQECLNCLNRQTSSCQLPIYPLE
ncbi:MAG TPA: hypothetical protein DD640_01380 [Clostridiales bacterium]|nr:hypothetical protein [Clostridiales bacterium]